MIFVMMMEHARHSIHPARRTQKPSLLWGLDNCLESLSTHLNIEKVLKYVYFFKSLKVSDWQTQWPLNFFRCCTNIVTTKLADFQISRQLLASHEARNLSNQFLVLYKVTLMLPHLSCNLTCLEWGPLN